jgi:hypothetical protein
MRSCEPAGTGSDLPLPSPSCGRASLRESFPVAIHPTHKHLFMTISMFKASVPIFMQLLTSLPVPILHGLALECRRGRVIHLDLAIGAARAMGEPRRFDTMPGGIKVAW